MQRKQMVYNYEEGWVDMSRRRVTDNKGNSRVIFPNESKNFEFESKLQVLRVEAMNTFKTFMRENCDSQGRQKSNRGQRSGLPSLLERVEGGECVIVPTDKTSKLVVMDKQLYEQAGLSHVKDDTEVGWDCIENSQN